MAYGGLISDSNGRNWITPEAAPLNLVNRFQWTLPASGQLNAFINTGISQNQTCVIFTKQINGNQTFNGRMIKQGGTWQYDVLSAGTGGYANPTASTFMVYVFANIVPTPEYWGMAVYNAQGQLTWNGTMIPLEMKRYNIPLTERPITISHGCAVMPGASQWALILEEEGSYYYSSSFNARGNLIERASTQVEDGVYGNENEGVINRTCYYINTDVYDTF
ncbi:hypothetical protein GFB57_18000 [Citrobacter sp. S39]|uniref:hypothetical protein n=1 Tax=Citrobacter TaxID=544 RepID=UPI0012A7D38D|nr:MULTISPECIES: hypothetical protein [Citrobacter]MDX7507813.1 hypothetical protein [Citrobacter freundii]QFX90379.1 hypothetical protein GFB57_18000 [Citrobacter sp. S39]